MSKYTVVASPVVINPNLNASEIVESFKAANPDFPVEMYLAGASGAVLANTLRSLARAGQKPQFATRPSPVVLATCQGSKGETHEIRIGKDGNCYCTCCAWRFQKVPAKYRTCKHINGLFHIA